MSTPPETPQNPADLYRAARQLCLASPGPFKPADLQRTLGVTWSQACRLLEELEGDGLLGSLSLDGLRRWSTAFPIDPARRAAFRKGRATI